MKRKYERKYKDPNRRPREKYPELSYEVKPVKKGRKVIWNVIESPSKNCVAKFEFKDDADSLAKFHNKNQVWKVNQGIPKMLWNYYL
jgi:hypothetical protein|tara:strand:- start:1784 stop:2044 length:261 start_codon:yes stop_codon:yes gene_type:complete